MAAAAAAAMLGKTRSYGEDKPMKSRDSVSLNSMEALQELASRTWSSRRGRGTLAELLDKEQNQQQQQDASISASGPFADADADASSYLCPAPPFVLRFSNLQYSVSAGGSFSRNPAQVVGFQQCGNAKLVLNDISGEARDGEIFAVLGHSGSGKSTLIDALAQRIRRGSLKGSVTLNGDPMNGNLFRSISAYVMQDDLLFPMLTVRETLLFAAEFRMPRGTAPEQKLQRVEALLDQLGLRGAAHTIIGDEGHRGVSGGERRRVSIGMDIIHDPILLFLDEPTSGLDSTSAFMVVKVLQRIARHGGSIVLMSIHQPSYRILGILDRVLLLAHGQTVFSGSPARLQPFFSAFGRPVPENGNSTEFALDLIQELESAPSGIKPLVEFHRSWADLDRDSALGPAVPPLADAVAQCVARGRLVAAADDSAKIARFANSAVTEIAILSRRSFTNMRRTPELFLMRLGMVMITGFLLATIFWKLDHSPKGVRERLSFFAFAMSTTFYTCADALPTFLQERYIFMRETAYNAYRRWSYVVAHALVSLPWLVVLATAFSAVTFWAVGLAGGASGFVYFTVMMLASFWAANSFVTFLSGAVPNLMIAYTIVVALLAYFLLLSGFFITRDRIPQYWIWFHYISLVKYPYEGVLQNEFHRPNACFARGTEVFDGTPMAALPSQMQESFLGLLRTTTNINITDETCVTTGIDVLQNQDITQLNKWQCLVVVAAWGFLFRFLFYVALLLGSKNKRR